MVSHILFGQPGCVFYILILRTNSSSQHKALVEMNAF